MLDRTPFFHTSFYARACEDGLPNELDGNYKPGTMLLKIRRIRNTPPQVDSETKTQTKTSPRTAKRCTDVENKAPA